MHRAQRARRCRRTGGVAYRDSVADGEPQWEQAKRGPGNRAPWDQAAWERASAEERRRLQEGLLGLDREHPDVRAFSDHLDRTHRQRPSFTVEGYLSGVTDFADSANRAQGLRRVWAVLLVLLILLGVGITVWESTLFIMSTLLG